MIAEATELWREPKVLAVAGTGRSTMWSYVKSGTFPAPVKIGQRSIAWPANEISAVNFARIAGKSENEIRALVARLEAARKAA